MLLVGSMFEQERWVWEADAPVQHTQYLLLRYVSSKPVQNCPKAVKKQSKPSQKQSETTEFVQGILIGACRHCLCHTFRCLHCCPPQAVTTLNIRPLIDHPTNFPCLCPSPGDPNSHPHYNQHHGHSHHPHGSHYNGGYGSQPAPPPPTGHYPPSSAWTHGTSMPTYQDDPPPGLESDTYIHRPYDLDKANAAQIAASNLADARRTAMGAGGCYGFDPNLTFLWAPPPGG